MLVGSQRVTVDEDAAPPHEMLALQFVQRNFDNFESLINELHPPCIMQFEGRLLLHYSMKCMSIPAGPRPGFLTTLSPADWSRAHTWWCFFRYKIPKASQLSVVKAYVSTWTLETECAWQCRSCGTQTVSLCPTFGYSPTNSFFYLKSGGVCFLTISDMK